MQEITPEIKTQIQLKDYTSWLIGGPADFFCLPTTIEELAGAITFARNKNIPVTVLGGGTNVLVSDKGIRGLTICLRRFSKLEFKEENGFLKIVALSGTGKSDLLKVFLKHQLAPALFMAGLPGDVGGGVVMNAGVAENFVPREFGELVEWVEVLDTSAPSLALKRLEGKDIQWHYRHSDGWQPGIVVRVGLTWKSDKDPDVLVKVREANRTRLSKQPLDMPSCGSVFVNPTGHKAAQLVDSCGLKGTRFGDAQVSTKHANFIVNLGQATADDTLKVIRFVQKKVSEEKGVQLRTEVKFLGEWEQKDLSPTY
ncbi:MAG: UDP-N-acetylmuramate dehydrogenase [Bdellovibrionota bacterium]